MTDSEIVWNEPPDHPLLGGKEVHVWRVLLDQFAQNIPKLWDVLPEDERGRADQFVYATDRNHFIAAHGMLRVILSRYTAIEPWNLRFNYNVYGKPFLDSARGEIPICFNLAHSHGVAIYAITQRRQVGIDIERIRRNIDIEAIAKTYFSIHEYQLLRGLPTEVQYEAFFMCWTRKEAYIKARGEGLSYPLDEFSVSLEPNIPAALLQNYRDPSEVLLWTLYHLVPDFNYIGAVAVQGRNFCIRYWHENTYSLSSRLS